MTSPSRFSLTAARYRPSPEELRQRRERSDLTQAQAAERVGVHVRSWQKWELGERRMPSATWRLFLQLTTSRSDSDRQILLSLSDGQARALAQFIQRLNWADFQGRAVDEEEADAVRDAVNAVQRALADAGYDPR